MAPHSRKIEVLGKPMFQILKLCPFDFLSGARQAPKQITICVVVNLTSAVYRDWQSCLAHAREQMKSSQF